MHTFCGSFLKNVFHLLKKTILKNNMNMTTKQSLVMDFNEIIFFQKSAKL